VFELLSDFIKDTEGVGEAFTEVLPDGFGEAILYACQGGAIEQGKEDFVVYAEVTEASHIKVTDAFVDLFGNDNVAIGGGDDARLLLKCSADVRYVEMAADTVGNTMKTGELIRLYAVKISYEGLNNEAFFYEFVCNHVVCCFIMRSKDNQ
jgi:hypothetical protein